MMIILLNVAYSLIDFWLSPFYVDLNFPITSRAMCQVGNLPTACTEPRFVNI